MSTEQDAADFWNEVKRLELANQTEDPVYEYRLYYNQHGTITSGVPVITNRPLPELPEGEYLIVTYEDYTHSHDKCVKNGQLQKIKNTIDVVNQLEKSTSGYRVVKNAAALLLNDNDDYQDTEHYDRRTS